MTVVFLMYVGIDHDSFGGIVPACFDSGVAQHSVVIAYGAHGEVICVKLRFFRKERFAYYGS